MMATTTLNHYQHPTTTATLFSLSLSLSLSLFGIHFIVLAVVVVTCYRSSIDSEYDKKDACFVSFPVLDFLLSRLDVGNDDDQDVESPPGILLLVIVEDTTSVATRSVLVVASRACCHHLYDSAAHEESLCRFFQSAIVPES